MTRDPRAIGAGLAAARPARAIRAGERIHVIGAAGAGASGAALLADGCGATVDGCDAGGPSPYTPPLEAAGLRLSWAHDPGHVTREPRPDRLAVTKALTAIDPDHPELAAARRLGIPLEPWQQVVADAAAGRRLVGVAGTHGKSTTAGWLLHVLVTAGLDPGALVGALLPTSTTGGLPATARRGRGSTFVVEADEYAGNFDAYRPDIAIVTNVDWDHPDVFADRGAAVDAFAGWLMAAADTHRLATEAPSPGRPDGRLGRLGVPGPVLVANAGDQGVEELLDRLADWPGSVVAVGVVDQAAQRLGGYARGVVERHARANRPVRAVLARAVDADALGTDIELVGLDPLAGPLRVRLPTAGRHNVANAVCVAAAAGVLGLDPPAIVSGLASFPGIGRRLERKGEAAGVVVYDDYGHHPTAIRETLLAVRQREPGRRVWAVYEPLTYHRTAAMLEDFADALQAADGVAIADVWAGRDPDTTVASASGLAGAIAARRPGLIVSAPGSPDATAAWLAREVRTGDAVLVMGGGRSYRIGELLLRSLEADGAAHPDPGGGASARAPRPDHTRPSSP